jgi:hypothetical protein
VVDTEKSVPTVPAVLAHRAHSAVPALVQEGADEGPLVLKQVLQAPQPSLQWPSDHFMIVASLLLPANAPP